MIVLWWTTRSFSGGHRLTGLHSARLLARPGRENSHTNGTGPPLFFSTESRTLVHQARFEADTGVLGCRNRIKIRTSFGWVDFGVPVIRSGSDIGLGWPIDRSGLKSVLQKLPVYGLFSV